VVVDAAAAFPIGELGHDLLETWNLRCRWQTAIIGLRHERITATGAGKVRWLFTSGDIAQAARGVGIFHELAAAFFGGQNQNIEKAHAQTARQYLFIVLDGGNVLLNRIIRANPIKIWVIFYGLCNPLFLLRQTLLLPAGLSNGGGGLDAFAIV